ncbi:MULTISPECIES: PspC domain-containing protein [unclassified Streptomyces]|uniref:PspC domain-containing protein n=1 Tax=unclassified Streptomyces TaxID=2593676 RepID=UPI00035E8654|nr:MULTISPECIES: PspC domain-containing protein [unclassified Streptomyces]MYT33231.1 PspC domain-containing protein [Streptomyces sp. SID8354]
MNDAPTAAEPASSGPAAPAPPPAPLRRSRRHKVVAGVCGGLGRQWDIDPVIFRVVLAVLSIGGLGLIFYGFAWLLVPLDGEEENEARRLLSGRVDGSALTALLCALAGCALFLTTLGKGSMLTFAIMVMLAVAGAAYWSRRRRRAQTEGPGSVDAATAQTVADAPPEATAPPAPNSPSWWRDPRTEPLRRQGYLWGPEDARLEITYDAAQAHGVTDGPCPRGSWSPGPGPAAAPRTAAAPPRPAPAAGRGIGGRTFLLAAVAGAGTALAVSRHAALSPSLQAGLAAALVVFGLGLVLSAWLGRTGGGTVFMAVLTAALLAGATALPANLTANWQHRTWTPTTVAAVQPHYAVGSGEGRLDLGRLPLKPGTTVRSSAEIGAGRLVVTLPPGATATLRLRLGVGDIQLPGDAANDVEIVAGHRERLVTLPAEGLKQGEQPRGAVELDLRVGAGQLAVERARAAPPSTPSPSPATTPQGAPQ